MTISEETNQALSRNEALATALLKIVDILPDFVPLKGNIQEQLNNLRSVIQGLRPPRIMVIGRCRAGKSSLINAICGLRVAEVSDTTPETGMAQWKKYYHDGTDLLHILDTRGLQEAQAPRQTDSATTPYDSIMQAVKKECPDVILFLCKATEVHSGSTEDLSICESIHSQIKKQYCRDLPIIGVLTKCDELAPPKVPLPTDNERKTATFNRKLKTSMLI
jgi:predicted GTPase